MVIAYTNFDSAALLLYVVKCGAPVYTRTLSQVRGVLVKTIWAIITIIVLVTINSFHGHHLKRFLFERNLRNVDWYIYTWFQILYRLSDKRAGGLSRWWPVCRYSGWWCRPLRYRIHRILLWDLETHNKLHLKFMRMQATIMATKERNCDFNSTCLSRHTPPTHMHTGPHTYKMNNEARRPRINSWSSWHGHRFSAKVQMTMLTSITNIQNVQIFRCDRSSNWAIRPKF